MKAYLSAQEASELLGISRATLYAYVSRGLIRSDEGDVRRRTRRYSAEDVERLRQRQQQRRDPEKSASEMLNWGTPIVDSAITRISEGRCSYRGFDAVTLAVERRVEEVASLIWTGSLDRWELLASAQRMILTDRFWSVRTLLTQLPPIDLMLSLLPIAASRDPAAYDLRPEAVAQTGTRILRAMVTATTGRPPDETGIGPALARTLAPDFSEASRLVNAALILCADHELNSSSFTARCVASTGSHPYHVVSAGLAALAGYRHGGIDELVEELFDSCAEKSSKEIRELLYSRLKRGGTAPGFGHPLYPEGDPRAVCIIDMMESLGIRGAEMETAARLRSSVLDVFGELPNISFALTVLSRGLRMPSGAAVTLFAIGRAMGWIGHAIEQYQSGRLIRPRARYTGPAAG